MKLAIVVSFLFVFQVFADAKLPQSEQVFHVPKWEWVTPVGSNETCGIEFRGKLEIVKVTSSGIALVKYTAPGTTAGTRCDSGVQLERTRHQLYEYELRFQEKLEKIKKNKEDVFAALADESPQEMGTYRVGSIINVTQHDWLNIVYPFSSFEGNDVCRVAPETGRLKIMGFSSNGQALLAYLTSDGRGTECAPVTMFFKQL